MKITEIIPIGTILLTIPLFIITTASNSIIEFMKSNLKKDLAVELY
ncbi:hypothetical protein [Clostridium intestinale]|uniref:Uncharacterized protein n=1 Tax=Clostridium intestinale DSM 6191 TaxID=1121320 RepID=A0A1M5U1Q5_9CLOT|nr:hypothetical protein [Clostridium intestinale]SHH56898.1 hypothetical protein SAMN02745941_00381 [Clostridium intestinale DSM 6191]